MLGKITGLWSGHVLTKCVEIRKRQQHGNEITLASLGCWVLCAASRRSAGGAFAAAAAARQWTFRDARDGAGSWRGGGTRPRWKSCPWARVDSRWRGSPSLRQWISEEAEEASAAGHRSWWRCRLSAVRCRPSWAGPGRNTTGRCPLTTTTGTRRPSAACSRWCSCCSCSWRSWPCGKAAEYRGHDGRPSSCPDGRKASWALSEACRRASHTGYPQQRRRHRAPSTAASAASGTPQGSRPLSQSLLTHPNVVASFLHFHLQYRKSRYNRSYQLGISIQYSAI